jgi:hypothetical protein
MVFHAHASGNTKARKSLTRWTDTHVMANRSAVMYLPDQISASLNRQSSHYYIKQRQIFECFDESNAIVAIFVAYDHLTQQRAVSTSTISDSIASTTSQAQILDYGCLSYVSRDKEKGENGISCA